MTDAEIFRKNVLIHKPSKMMMIEMETKAGYGKDHLSHMVKRNWNVTVEHIKCYAKAVGVAPEKLLEGMFDAE